MAPTPASTPKAIGQRQERPPPASPRLPLPLRQSAQQARTWNEATSGSMLINSAWVQTRGMPTSAMTATVAACGESSSRIHEKTTPQVTASTTRFPQR